MADTPHGTCDDKIVERFDLVVGPAGGWSAIAAALARKIADVGKGDRTAWWFMLSTDTGGSYDLTIGWTPWEVDVQLYDDWFDDSRSMAEEVATELLATGWGRPDHFDGFHPGWWKRFEAPYDLGAICHEAVGHFVAGFGFEEGVGTTLQFMRGGEIFY